MLCKKTILSTGQMLWQFTGSQIDQLDAIKEVMHVCKERQNDEQVPKYFATKNAIFCFSKMQISSKVLPKIWTFASFCCSKIRLFL